METRVKFFLRHFWRAVLLAVALFSKAEGVVVISDDFSQPNFDTGNHSPFNVYGSRIWDGVLGGSGLVPNSGTTPGNTILGANLPGGSWQWGGGAGNDYDGNEIGNLNGYGASNVKLTGGTVYIPYARIHNKENVAISLAGSNVNTQFTISIDVCPQSNDCYVGFDSTLKTTNNFTGLRVDQTGGVSLFINGSMTGTVIPFTGTFSNVTASLLNFTVNTTTGAISNISLQGSTSTYSFTTTAFTSAATSYAALYAPPGGNSIFAYLQISSSSATSPPPPVILPPSPPTNLVATAGKSQVVLSWSASTGATSYNIFRGTTSEGESSTPIATAASSLTYIDASVTNGTAYYYTVEAVDSAGSSGYSNEVNALPSVPIPPAPTALTVTSANGEVILSWTASPGASAYNVYSGTTSGGESTLVTGVTSTSYTDPGVTNGTTYYFEVTATNSSGSSASSPEASGTPSAPSTSSSTPIVVISDDFSQPNFDTGSHTPYNVYGNRIWDGAPGGGGLVPNNGTTPGKTALGADLPGGAWQFGGGAGYDYDCNEIGNLPGYGASNIELTGGTSPVPYARIHNGENVAISLAGYNSNTQLAVSVDVCPQTNDCYVGFDSILKVTNNFSGLRVDQAGGVSLFVSGAQVGSVIPFTGIFSKATASLLNFSVNTQTGAVSNISLQGSTSTYGFTTSAFTPAATAYAALDAPSGGNSAFAHLQITAASLSVSGTGPSGGSTGSGGGSSGSGSGSGSSGGTAGSGSSGSGSGTSGSGSTGGSTNPTPNLNPFGIGGDNTTTETLSTYAPQMSAAGVAWMRGIDTWSDIEPYSGTFNFANVDSELAAASANNMQVSGMFFYGSNWVSSTSDFPTTNLSAWQAYIAALVTHVNGKVKNWEVWNEPPGTSNGTATDYANIVNSAYSAAHGADPTCSIGLCAASNNVNWLYDSINAGAADHFDYVVVHPYEMLGAVDSGWEAEFMSVVPTLRKMLADCDPGRANAPIWFTEVGESIGDVNGTVTVTPTSQAQDLVKAFSMGIAQGVSHINWFEGKDGDSGPMGLLDGSGNARPAYTALSQLTKYLGPNPTYLGWVQLNGKDYGFIFQGATTTVMATWSPPGGTDTVAFSPAVTIVDPVGGTSTASVSSYPLTNAPVLVIGVPATLVTAAQTNRTQPFPWGGNYTNATSVSCVMSEPNQEAGLHQLYADSTSTYSTTPYGPARYCGQASGQSFTVDPNFLSYTARTIKITAVVRSDAANDSAGFNVKYEGSSGWESVPNWNSIPGNSQWYTLTWTITDPQFVGKWGYNFMFDSDSTSHSEYYIQSVTVSK